jgi:hypothetical protein
VKITVTLLGAAHLFEQGRFDLIKGLVQGRPN